MPKKKKEAKKKEPDPELAAALAGLQDDPNMPTSSDGKAAAAFALGSLVSGSDVFRQDAIAAGCLVPLVTMLEKGTEREKEAAAFALRGLSTNTCVYTLRGMPFAGKLSPSTYPVVGDSPTAIVSANAVAPLVALLRDGTTCAQKEHAAAALCNISTKAPFRAAIAAAGAIVPLVELIRKGPEDVAAAAAFAIGSLAFGSAANRAQIMDADGRRWLEALLAREVVDGIDAEKRQRIVAYALGELDPHVVAAREKAKADVLAAAAEAARAGDDGKKDDKKGKKKWRNLRVGLPRACRRIRRGSDLSVCKTFLDMKQS
jgi:hypothetical protein